MVCDAGGPYEIECDTDGAPAIQLDGSASEDPDEGGLTYEWTTTCVGAMFDDNTIESPVLTLATPLVCMECDVSLSVTEEDGGTSTCTAPVSVTDDEAPTVGAAAPIDDCYDDLATARQAACDATVAVANDNCNPQITCDTTYNPPAGTCDVMIFATVSDGCGNAASPTTFQTTVDGEAPTIGTIDPIDFCFEDEESALAAAEAAALAAASDNCTPTALLAVTSSASSPECASTITVGINDECENGPTETQFSVFIDNEAPVVTCPPDLQVECGFPYEPGEATATDNCVLNPPVTLDETIIPGNCAEEEELLTTAGIAPPPKLTIKRDFGSSDSTPTVAGGAPGCDNVGACVQLIEVFDTIPPEITHCPEPITVARGDLLCNDEVRDWLNSFQATDICGPVVLTNDAPECGFPAGTTTTVVFTATDECALQTSCTSTITVGPLERASIDTKGSLLIFSKVEIKWDASGRLIQDTFLDFSNDADAGSVDVQAYFINGDIALEELIADDGSIVQSAEPGWNSVNCRFHLTKNQPHYWSAANGSTLCQPFTILDEDGPGRPDVDGGRILRGFVVMWAVKFAPTLIGPGDLDGDGVPNALDNCPNDANFDQANQNSDSIGNACDPDYTGPPGVAYPPDAGGWEEIRWNHLKGDGLIVNYAEGSAWEYNAYAYQERCGAEGAGLADCESWDAAGVCCATSHTPGRLDLDGFQYDLGYDKLLLDFYATGTAALSQGGVGGTDVSLDTDLTLHSTDIDLRQDGYGPVLTKMEFEVFNQNEIKLSGLRRCVCCWDQRYVSQYAAHAGIPNYFLRHRLGTDKGQARIDGVRSDECDYLEWCGIEPRDPEGLIQSVGGVAGRPVRMILQNRDTAILGLAIKHLTFIGSAIEIDTAGMSLVGVGFQSSTIKHDAAPGAGEARIPFRGPQIKLKNSAR